MASDILTTEEAVAAFDSDTRSNAHGLRAVAIAQHAKDAAEIERLLAENKWLRQWDRAEDAAVEQMSAEIERLRARLAAMTAAPENTHAQCPMCKLAIRPSLTNNGIGPVWHAVHCGWGHEMLSPNMTEEYAAAYNAGYKEAVDVTQSKYLALGATIDRLNAERADYQGRTGELRAEIERLRAELSEATQMYLGTAADHDRQLERATAAEQRVAALETELATERERAAGLVAALARLRDCDWTIGIGDRMDPVRDIARNAISASGFEVVKGFAEDFDPGVKGYPHTVAIVWTDHAEGRVPCYIVTMKGADNENG